ncbi:DUF932 domain-containing protein [bacterium]|nr:DUF932 domain-containing protein [bacterium]
MELMLHCGANEATAQDLAAVPVPRVTNSYCPVTHDDLANMLADMGQSILSGFELARSQFGLSKDGQQLFGIHTFQNSGYDLGLSVGFRNSYNKTLSVGIAVGASVFVCDNLALTGDITVMRKHTLNVQSDLEQLAVTSILKARSAFYQVNEDAQRMKELPLEDNNAFRLIGLLYGHGIITPRQIPVTNREWLKPQHAEFEPRTMWSFYNAVTEALKSSPPRTIMERHLKLHKLINQPGLDLQRWQYAAG